MIYSLSLTITVILLLFYGMFFLYSYKGWNAVLKTSELSSDDLITKIQISIIAPFRNEEKVLQKFIHSIEYQDYPAQFFELILVDDHSDDNSVNIVQSYIELTNKQFRLLHLSANDFAKKSAIEKGVSHAKGELIITTDVDTTRSAKWLDTLSKFYRNRNADMIIGPVILSGENSWLDNFQQIEFSTLQYITASFAGNKNPILCNGANLAFRKALFEETGGFQNTPELASGDDVFVLQKFKNLKNVRIEFLMKKDAIVLTDSTPDLVSFIRQRVRWAGKTRAIPDLSLKSVAVLTFMMAAWMPILLLSELRFSAIPVLSLIFITAKFILDFIVIKNICKATGQYFNFLRIVPAFLTHPVYIGCISIVSIFYKPLWKGRKIYPH